MTKPITNSGKTPILVTGGTGTLGRLVVAKLRNAGHDVRVLSRARRRADVGPGIAHVAADLTTGAGLDAALSGIEVVVHLAGSAKGDAQKASLLVPAAARAGIRHLVYISVVGDDRVPIKGRLDRAMFGYFAEKLAAGRIVRESGIPWTILRATQVHQTLFTTIQGMARLPVMPVPAGVRFQPIDAKEVADRLAELALTDPAGQVPDMGGPRVYEMVDLVRGYLQATGRHRLIFPMPITGAAAQAVRDGATLTPERAVGLRTWEEFLVSRVRTHEVDRSLAA
jgi:uncharacterized protein YbjT (DUF2867 family)